MARDVLKEFLVAIAFDVNDPSQKAALEKLKKVEEKITAADKTEADKRAKKDREARAKSIKEFEAYALKISSIGLGLAAAVIGAAMGITRAVETAARSYNDLYYASKKIGASAKDINAFEYAASQLGSTTEKARGSLQAFGDRMRQNPQGWRNFARGLGLDAGQGQNTVQIIESVSKAFQGMGYAQAHARASALGIDEDTFRALMNPEFMKRVQEYTDMQAKLGLDPDAAAEAGKRFEQVWTKLGTALDLLKDKISTSLFPVLQKYLDQFTTWILDHGDELSKSAVIIGEDVVNLAGAFGELLSKVDWDALLKNLTLLLENMSGLLTKVSGSSGLQGAFEALAIFVAGAWAAKMILAIGSVVRAMGPLAALLGLAQAAQSNGVLQGFSDPGISDVDKAPDGIWSAVKRKWGHRSTWLGGDGYKKGYGRKSLGSKLNMEPPVPFSSDEFNKATGSTSGQYAAVRDGIAKIENARYNQMGGSNNRFAGRYQMGADEIAETARSLGEAAPSQSQFLADPTMQEKFFQRYTLNHYKQLMRDPTFAALPLKDKLGILGYAHNQGAGGAMKYLRSGLVGRDAFGTAGTAYISSIKGRLDAPIATDAVRPLTITRPGRASSPYGNLAPFNPAPPPGTTSNNNVRGDLNLTNAPVFNFAGTGDQMGQASMANQMSSRGQQDMLRNIQVAEV